MREIVQDEIQLLQEECAERIENLTARLAQIARRLDGQRGALNPLGELQSQWTILDCRLATLGCLRDLVSRSVLRAVDTSPGEESD